MGHHVDANVAACSGDAVPAWPVTGAGAEEKIWREREFVARAPSQAAEALLADVEKAELGLKLLTDFLERTAGDPTWGCG